VSVVRLVPPWWLDDARRPGLLVSSLWWPSKGCQVLVVVVDGGRHPVMEHGVMPVYGRHLHACGLVSHDW
jgi:hypothetical protein